MEKQEKSTTNIENSEFRARKLNEFVKLNGILSIAMLDKLIARWYCMVHMVTECEEFA